VRLRNWVGEVLLSLPTLQALQDSGYTPVLVGQAWARELLAPTSWQLHVKERRRDDAVRQLRMLADEQRKLDPRFDDRPNALLFTHSFSSAFEARMAGLKAVGLARDWRSLLLFKALRPAPARQVHVEYRTLADPFIGPRNATEPCMHHKLSVSQAARQAARDALRSRGIDGDYLVFCPLSGCGDVRGQRRWPHFEALRRIVHSSSCPVVTCAGPGEVEAMRAACPGAIDLPGLGLQAYGAILQGATAVVANDTGSGHLAAAVGARLISVLGPHSRAYWYPIGPRGRVLHPSNRWPTPLEVVDALFEMPHGLDTTAARTEFSPVQRSRH